MCQIQTVKVHWMQENPVSNKLKYNSVHTSSTFYAKWIGWPACGTKTKHGKTMGSNMLVYSFNYVKKQRIVQRTFLTDPPLHTNTHKGTLVI